MLDSPTGEPIVTLFALQYASPTSPHSNEFEAVLGVDALEYLEAMLERYDDKVTYWEIGNEMNHWSMLDSEHEPVQGLVASDSIEDFLNAQPQEGDFNPEDQGRFLREVAEFVRAKDPDAVIVLPGLSGAQ